MVHRSWIVDPFLCDVWCVSVAPRYGFFLFRRRSDSWPLLRSWVSLRLRAISGRSQCTFRSIPSSESTYYNTCKTNIGSRRYSSYSRRGNWSSETSRHPAYRRSHLEGLPKRDFHARGRRISGSNIRSPIRYVRERSTPSEGIFRLSIRSLPRRGPQVVPGRGRSSSWGGPRRIRRLPRSTYRRSRRPSILRIRRRGL